MLPRASFISIELVWLCEVEMQAPREVQEELLQEELGLYLLGN